MNSGGTTTKATTETINIVRAERSSFTPGWKPASSSATGTGAGGLGNEATRLSSTRTFEQVLRHVAPGRTLRLDVSHVASSTRKTAEFEKAKLLLAHLLGARNVAGRGYWVDHLPVTAPALEAVSVKLGRKEPRDACRRYWKLLIETGVIVRAGQYTQRLDKLSPNAQYLVKLYRVKITSALRPRKKNFPPAAKKPSRVLVPWYEDSVWGFGITGRPRGPSGRPVSKCGRERIYREIES